MNEDKNVRILITDNRGSPTWRYIRQILSTGVTFSLLFGPGVYAGSNAMQWAGFIILMVMVVALIAASNNNYLPIEDAQKKIDEIKNRLRQD